jgi:phosphosulfolactate phosphohydrolase-like enzyme
MLISSFVLALALQASPTAAPQKAFVACLQKTLVAGLDDKTEPGAIAQAYKTQCADPEAAYRAAMIAADRKSGVPAAAAQASAEDEISYWRDKFTEDYRMYVEDGTRPNK